MAKKITNKTHTHIHTTRICPRPKGWLSGGARIQQSVVALALTMVTYFLTISFLEIPAMQQVEPMKPNSEVRQAI